jgi:hypothetical protein
MVGNIEQYSELTRKYVEALRREGDNFDPSEWFWKAIEQSRREKLAMAWPPSELLPSGSTGSSSSPLTRPASLPAKPSLSLSTSVYPGGSQNRIARRLASLSDLWDDVQESRNRDAIYRYLGAVFDLIAAYKGRRRRKRLLRRAYKFAGRAFDEHANPFAAIIRCTSGGEADRKAISKYARALTYVYCQHSRPRGGVKRFIKRAGGINVCAARYAALRRRKADES